MHSQLAGGAALVAVVFLEHGSDEPPLEFLHRFGIQNVALVHLLHERFQLIFHRISLTAPANERLGN